jgi:hypothetical protein
MKRRIKQERHERPTKINKKQQTATKQEKPLKVRTVLIYGTVYARDRTKAKSKPHS